MWVRFLSNVVLPLVCGQTPDIPFYYSITEKLRSEMGSEVVDRGAMLGLRKRFYYMEVPESLPVYMECEDFGFQYSMEVFFAQFIQANWHMQVYDWRLADFIILPHCVSMVYFTLRNITSSDHWRGIGLAEDKYLKPLVEYARNHPAHARYNGANFFMVYSMDLGRQDFPQVVELTANWSVGTLTGRTSWLQEHSDYFLAQDFLPKNECHDADTIPVTKDRVHHLHDFVIPIPSRFEITVRSQELERPRFAFFAGSPNSCARKKMLKLYGHLDDDYVMVTTKILEDKEYRETMYTTKYCFVLRGSSHTNNVRLYDVMAHGCIPVIISDDFQPTLETKLKWQETAIFMPTSDIPRALTLLHQIDEPARLNYFVNVVVNAESAAKSLDWNAGLFWVKVLTESCERMWPRMLERRATAYNKILEMKHQFKEWYLNFIHGLGCPRDQCSNPSVEVSTGVVGCADGETVLPALALIYQHIMKVRADGIQPGIFVDAGANAGKFTNKVYNLLGDLYSRRLQAENPNIKKFIVCPVEDHQPHVKVVSIEPSPHNWAMLKTHAMRERWDLEGWSGVHSALSDFDGEAQLFMNPEFELDEVATLLPSQTEMASGNLRESCNVSVVSLNTIIANHQIEGKHPGDPDIFLMKLDVEGAEMKVMTHNYDFWDKRKVKFVVFEYSSKVWEVTGATLWMLPIFNHFYEDIYGSLIWSNVFCGHMDDPDLLDFLKIYHPADSEIHDSVQEFIEIMNGSERYGP